MIPLHGVPYNHGEVYKLNKALYGLKRAPRVWFEKFSTIIISLGFSSSDNDQALFVKCVTTCHIFISLPIDDMIITGNDIDGITVLKFELVRKFQMKDLGPHGTF